jgi:membrane-bound metal-dependent hydrolase YbcI (DUF457 family)
MLGRDHALVGGVGYLAVAPLLLDHTATWQVLGVGCVTSAAFALLPDIDEPGSTVSRKLGPLSRGVAEVTNKVAGGHRQATHSLLFAALVSLGAYFAAQHRLAIAIVVAASFLLVFRMLLPRMIRYAGLASIAMVALGGGAAWWVFHDYAQAFGAGHQIQWEWFVLATGGGCIWHLVGDSLTVEGVPYLWLPGVKPLQKLRVAVPVVGHCGSARESLIGVCLMVALVWMAAVMVIVPGAHSVGQWHLHIPAIHVPGHA